MGQWTSQRGRRSQLRTWLLPPPGAGTTGRWRSREAGQSGGLRSLVTVAEGLGGVLEAQGADVLCSASHEEQPGAHVPGPAPTQSFQQPRPRGQRAEGTATSRAETETAGSHWRLTALSPNACPPAPPNSGVTQPPPECTRPPALHLNHGRPPHDRSLNSTYPWPLLGIYDKTKKTRHTENILAFV